MALAEGNVMRDARYGCMSVMWARSGIFRKQPAPVYIMAAGDTGASGYIHSQANGKGIACQ